MIQYNLTYQTNDQKIVLLEQTTADRTEHDNYHMRVQTDMILSDKRLYGTDKDYAEEERIDDERLSLHGLDTLRRGLVRHFMFPL